MSGVVQQCFVPRCIMGSLGSEGLGILGRRRRGQACVTVKLQRADNTVIVWHSQFYFLSDYFSKTSWPNPQLWIMYHEEQTHRDGNISLFSILFSSRLFSSALQTDVKTVGLGFLLFSFVILVLLSLS